MCGCMGSSTRTNYKVPLSSLTSIGAEPEGAVAALGAASRHAEETENSVAAAAAAAALIRCMFHFVIQGWLNTASIGSRHAG